MTGRANSQICGRSQELTKNLVNTRLQLENHFKSIKRREADFRKQKLVNFEEELKATARMARPAPASASRKRSPSPREASRSSAAQRAKSSEPLGRSLSGSSGGAVTGSAGSLSRSWSSPEGWPHSSAPQFPQQWGGHGHLPKPPGNPAAYPLAVTRHCADTPACQHPPPHPGAYSMRPSKSRSLVAFSNSHTAAFLMPSPPQMVSAASHSPATPPPRRPQLAERSLISAVDEDVTLAEAGTDGVGKDPMITRLGHFMALLGPRYKCCSKDMIWEQAERGERTPFQRRLHKLGGIEAVGGGPDRLRPSPSAPGELVLAADSDGKARTAWLAARTAERDRRNRVARSLGRAPI